VPEASEALTSFAAIVTLAASLLSLPAIAAAIEVAIVSAARHKGSASRCAYRCVVAASEWPSSSQRVAGRATLRHRHSRRNVGDCKCERPQELRDAAPPPMPVHVCARFTFHPRGRIFRELRPVASRGPCLYGGGDWKGKIRPAWRPLQARVESHHAGAAYV
jgi:hypothetical protein